MKPYVGLEIQLHTFLTVAPDGGERPFMPWPLYFWAESPRDPLNRSLGGPQAWVRCPGCQSAASGYQQLLDTRGRDGHIWIAKSSHFNCPSGFVGILADSEMWDKTACNFTAVTLEPVLWLLMAGSQFCYLSVSASLLTVTEWISASSSQHRRCASDVCHGVGNQFGVIVKKGQVSVGSSE